MRATWASSQDGPIGPSQQANPQDSPPAAPRHPARAPPPYPRAKCEAGSALGNHVAPSWVTLLALHPALHPHAVDHVVAGRLHRRPATGRRHGRAIQASALVGLQLLEIHGRSVRALPILRGLARRRTPNRHRENSHRNRHTHKDLHLESRPRYLAAARSVILRSSVARHSHRFAADARSPSEPFGFACGDAI